MLGGTETIELCQFTLYLLIVKRRDNRFILELMLKLEGRVPASKKDLLEFLSNLGIHTNTISHVPLFTVEDGKELLGDVPGGHCKSLFLRDKKGELWLVVMLGDGRLNMSALQKKLGSGRLSFGTPDLMRGVLGVGPGSVTPFALMNETARDVNVILDRRMLKEELLNYHPLSNDATTTLASKDLLKFIRAVGHEARIIDI